MKNETTRTKTQTGFSSRAIALVLCFVMLLTAIGSGSVLSAIAVAAEGSGAAELVDAAKAGADVNAPAPGEAEESSDVLEPEDIDDGFVLSKKGDSDIADTGKSADLAGTGASTVYFLNKDNWTTVKAYCFDPNEETSWSGTDMTNVYGRIYSHSTTRNKVIFNNGSDQTSNLAVNNGQVFVYGSGWDTSVGSYTFYVKNDASWSNIYAYTYYGEPDVAWPGTQIVNSGSPVNNDNFTVTVLSDGVFKVTTTNRMLPANIILSNGNGGDNNQTYDLTFTSGKLYKTGSKSASDLGPNDYTELVNPKTATAIKSGKRNDGTNRVMSGDGTVAINGGTANSSTTTATVESESSVTFTAAANSDSDFNGWYSDEACTTLLTKNTTYTVASMTSDTTVYASFSKKCYLVGKFYLAELAKEVTPAYNDTTYGFTQSSSNPALYTYENDFMFRLSPDEDTYHQQYVTVGHGGSTAYKTASGSAASGTAASGADNNANSNKWTCDTGASYSNCYKHVVFTWNAINETLSWTITDIDLTQYTVMYINCGDWHFDHLWLDGGVVLTDGYYIDLIGIPYETIGSKAYNILLVKNTTIGNKELKYQLKKADNTTTENLGGVLAGGTYTIDTSSDNWNASAGAPTAATVYYLTGWLNGASETGNTHAFTNTSGDTWTYSFSPSSDQGGYQYMTIKASDGTVYHANTLNAGSGTAASATTDTDTQADYKWRAAAVSGQTVTLTWNSSTKVLSWTTSGAVTTGSWKYTSNNADASPEQTGSSTYNFVWSNNDNGPGKSGTTAISAKNGGSEYWADITSLAKSNSNFYFALSNNTSNSGIRGDKSEQINGTTKSAGNTVTMTNSKNETIFYVEMKEKSSVTGGAYFQLVRGVDWTKISAIGVSATYSGSGAVNYKYYYKEIGSGSDQITSVTVYAKDGAAPINWDSKGDGGADAIGGTKYNYAAIATTTLTSTGVTPTSVECGNASSKYQTAQINSGTQITVKTTIGSTYKDKYYVAGWCINGATYKTNGTPGVNAEGDTNSSGECTMTYTIPAEPDVDYLEITPIYYIRSSVNIDVITFYLEGYNTVIEKWGNTPYIYPFYGNQNNVDNSFGVYPGQPMVYAEGKYSTQIPLKDYPIAKASQNIAIKGITINNGYADHVHRNMIYGWTAHDNDADHKQTYDYDDFYKIYEECLTNAAGDPAGHPNSIIFRIQDETATYNRDTYGGSKSGARVVSTENSLSSTDLSDINSGNGWEVLRNRYGQPIDLFGDVVSAEPSGPTSVGDNVRVVSTGYNANIAGDYGTAWKVYKKTSNTTYSLISDSTNDRYAAPPSIFLLRGSASGYNSAVATVGYPEADHSVDGVGSYTDSISKYEGIYKAAYGDNAVKGKPVYITYEKDAQDTRDDSSGTGAYRLDGRWYYTHSNDEVQSTVGIEYWNNSTAKWVKDTVTESNGNGTSGGTNKNNVKFNSDSYKDSSHVTTSKSFVINEGKTWNFTAIAGTGYIFEGWYIKYSDTSYDKIVGAAEAASIKATANYELIARFVPIVTGSLTIDHKLSASSTGEGDVDMTVVVKNGSSTLQTFTGSHVYIDGTYISNSYSTYTIDVTLTTTPKYDGKVTSFGYDKFNSSKNITATTNPGTLPGNENGETTSTFSFTVGDLYAGTTLSTTDLVYTSMIEETPHYYNFTYNFTSRGSNNANDKSFTSKGVISLKDYKQYVGETGHTLATSYVKAKAPFESNFLKKNTLTPDTPAYSNHTFTATSNFGETAEIPVYTVRFKLPYDYYTEKSGDHKMYTVNGSTYNADKATFDLAAKYDEFVTGDATDTTPGTSTNVLKSTAPNHTDNDFITAPDTVGDHYFAFWSIKRLADNDAAQATAPEVARIYYPDFHYRIYGDYYVEAVFSNKEADSWHKTYTSTGDNGCSILYVGDSRNQWNSGSGATDDSQAVAADKIYNDFIFNYRNNGAELTGSNKVKIGMIIERVVDRSGTQAKWAVGSASVSDMSYYETVNYGEEVSTVKADILSKLGTADSVSTATMRKGCIGIDWSTANLNNKNNLEENYYAYSAYGQTVGANSIEFKNNNAIDTYVYRAYAVMKYDSDGDNTLDKWCISDPAYFCMRYTANLKYSD